MPFIITIIIVSFLCVLSACGGGEAGGNGLTEANPAGNGYTVQSGLAQKGPLMQGSQITINELSTPNFQPTGRSFSLEISSNDGKFNPSGIYFVSPYLFTSALGYYFNEISGLASSDVVFLRGLSDLSAGADTVINVNALSSISKSRILNLVTGTNLLNPSTGLAYSSPPAKLPFASARTQAQAENLKAFYIYNSATLLSGKNAQPANFTALDLSQNRAADQILAAFSAVVMTAGQNGNGVNTLLSQIEADFADDGLLNNSPKYPQSVSSRLCAAAAGTNFAAVAANLNNFYGTKYQPTDLSQWVDTSGCVDQVIDKYKFSASNVAVGAVSKSPAYIVGPDDVGQCFSVGGVSGGATASLYYNGAATAVAATQLAKLGDRMELGLSVPSTTGTISAFIQRSAPVAYGTCPTSAPSGQAIRLQKYIVRGEYLPQFGQFVIQFAYRGTTPEVYDARLNANTGQLLTSINSSWTSGTDATTKTSIRLSDFVYGGNGGPSGHGHISISPGGMIPNEAINIDYLGDVYPWYAIYINFQYINGVYTIINVGSNSPGVNSISASFVSGSFTATSPNYIPATFQK